MVSEISSGGRELLRLTRRSQVRRCAPNFFAHAAALCAAQHASGPERAQVGEREHADHPADGQADAAVAGGVVHRVMPRGGSRLKNQNGDKGSQKERANGRGDAHDQRGEEAEIAERDAEGRAEAGHWTGRTGTGCGSVMGGFGHNR